MCLEFGVFLKKLAHVALQKSHDNFQKWGVVTVNHMNYDVAEVNSSDPQMLPGSFLYEKEPGYEALLTKKELHVSIVQDDGVIVFTHNNTVAACVKFATC